MKIPVIRGKIGDWIYYSGTMTFSQVSENVTASINEIFEASCLDEILQRALTDNFESIKNYILKDGERFFNAVILAIYNGDPQWLEVEFNEEESEFTNVGFLEFSGKETIFPVDGQHRVAGIREALKENPSLAKEQLPVIFIAHSDNPRGRKRTRKLFSTLNRRAKPVGQNENIALDEDDVCSIITREIIQEIPLLRGKNIVNSLGKQIPNTNSTAITSLIALYQCVDLLVKHKLAIEGIRGKKYSDYKLYRPQDEVIDSNREYVYSVFNSFIRNTTVIEEYLSEDCDEKAKKFRNSDGGNLLFRPIAFTEYFEAAFWLQDRREHTTYDDAFTLLNVIDLDIGKAPWLGLVWDGSKIINKVSKTTIRYLLVFLADSAAMTEKDVQKLVRDYASGTNRSETESALALGINPL